MKKVLSGLFVFLYTNGYGRAILIDAAEDGNLYR